jgi:hypothetical protein
VEVAVVVPLAHLVALVVVVLEALIRVRVAQYNMDLMLTQVVAVVVAVLVLARQRLIRQMVVLVVQELLFFVIMLIQQQHGHLRVVNSG